MLLQKFQRKLTGVPTNQQRVISNCQKQATNVRPRRDVTLFEPAGHRVDLSKMKSQSGHDYYKCILHLFILIFLLTLRYNYGRLLLWLLRNCGVSNQYACYRWACASAGTRCCTLVLKFWDIILCCKIHNFSRLHRKT